MRILVFTLCLLFPAVAFADGITFTAISTSITLPANFTAGFQGVTGDSNGWKYFSHANGGAIRYMEPMAALTPNASGHVSYLWLAALTQTPFPGALAFTTTLNACVAGECKPVTFSGSLTSNGASGLAWQSHGPAQTIALGGDFYYLTPLQNPIRAWNSTLDPAFSVQRVAQTPEPATLTALGLGLLGIARRLRRRQ